MEYEVETLEHIITIVLNPATISRQDLNEKFIAECLLQAETEKQRIKKRFRVMVFEIYQQGLLESYYHKHQAILLQLTDMAFGYLRAESPDNIYQLTKADSIINGYKELLRIPEELLEFLEKNFQDYFDNSLKIPEMKKQLLAPEVKRNLKMIQKELLKAEVEVEFIKIVCQPFEDYLLTGTGISYHELSYLLVLQRELISFTKQHNEGNVNEQMCRLLLQLNFNSILFFNYYILQLKEKTKECNANTELIAFHSLQLKIINQLPVKTRLVYKPDVPPIREQIGSWLCEELYYLEKQERFLYVEPESKKELQSNETKVQTSLSVSHLAMAVKLLMEAKLITNKNSSDILRMVARNFKTNRQEVISEESLRNKFYNLEKATVIRVKDEIIGLMNLVRKY